MNGLRFLDGLRLWLLLLPAVLLVAYVVLQLRRPRYTLRFTGLDLLAKVAPDRPGWRRHLPALALLLGVMALVLATAKPVRAEEVPQPLATVVLALDVSNSMQATDVAPSRLAAAKDAATRFVDLVPDGVQISLVTFSETVQVRVAPTDDRDALVAAIDRLRLGPGTAIGEAIYASLAVLPEAVTADGTRGSGSADATEGVADGDTSPGSIVLLSDGETTSGRSEAEAARAAEEAGVPVSTVAFGTDRGTIEIDGQTVPVPVDTAALRGVARTTDGTFAAAASAEQLTDVFEGLGRTAGTTTEERDVSGWFLAAALVLLLGAAAGSLVWFSRLP
ncbi:MAG: VWA domain-containing protein [Acidimicrobiales bacterium]|nr:VWA domain-containing protein [Acidimicrobiales bacterium]